MLPSQFVAILGTSPETDWPALTGRDENCVGRESRKNGRIWFWNLLFLRKLRLTLNKLLIGRRILMKKLAVTLGVVLGAAVVGLGIHKWRK
jgi:hypothetical protein